jgi:hypothetical protein
MLARVFILLKWRSRGVTLATVVFAAACTTRLPDQDLRILDAAPVERLSAAILWGDFQKDAAAANRRFHGQAIVVTGQDRELGSDEPGRRFVRFLVADGKGAVRAHLLDEQASTILAAAEQSPRVTLKCFCEGLAGDVILRSCVAP